MLQSCHDCGSETCINHSVLLIAVGQNLERDVSAKAKAPSGLGKSLPVPANKSSVQAIQNQVAELCTQTAAILHADEDCRVYLRECAGLASVCHLLSRV